MDPLETVLLAVAAFTSGAVNAIAGGGSLISFPALLAAGYPSKVANVTNTVAVAPGNFGGSIAYRKELLDQKPAILSLAIPTLAGALLGSAILISTPESTFDRLVPFLILSACAVLGLQDRIGGFAARHKLAAAQWQKDWLLRAGIFLVAIYGAYFGAGMGIVVLALLGILMPDDIQRSNALKGLFAFAVNTLAAVYFGLVGPVAWTIAGIMAVAALAGGYGGVSVARRLSRQRLRSAVIVYGTVAAFYLMLR